MRTVNAEYMERWARRLQSDDPIGAIIQDQPSLAVRAKLGDRNSAFSQLKNALKRIDILEKCCTTEQIERAKQIIKDHEDTVERAKEMAKARRWAIMNVQYPAAWIAEHEGCTLRVAQKIVSRTKSKMKAKEEANA